MGHSVADPLLRRAKESGPDGRGSGFQNLGVQVTAQTLQASTFARDAQGEWVLCAVSRAQPAAKLLIFGVRDGRLRATFRLPGANGAWGAATTTDGLVYLATENNGKLFRYDPVANEVADLGEALPGQTFLWHLAAGRDGAVFGCTYPDCLVFRYHRATGFQVIGGGPVVAGEQYARAVAYDVEADLLYVGVGVRPHLVEIDLGSNAKHEIRLPQLDRAQTAYSLSIVGDRLFVMLMPQQQTVVLNRRTHEVEALIQTSGLYQLTSPPSPYNGNVYYVCDHWLLEYDLNHPEQAGRRVGSCSDPLTMQWLPGIDDSQGPSLVIFDTSGSLIEYQPATGRFRSRSLKVTEEPAKVQSIFNGAGGQIWLGGYLSGCVARLDLRRMVSEKFRGFMQTESGGAVGAQMYFGVYPHCQLWVYDTDKPWDIAEGNPRELCRLVERDQSRPVAMVSVESLKKVFVGTVAEYGVLGGALSVYDVERQKLECYPNLIRDQSIISLAESGGIIFGGTSISGGLGIAPTQEHGKLFAWDPATRELLMEMTPVPATAISGLVADARGQIWGIGGGTVFCVDPRRRQVVLRREVYQDDAAERVIWRDGYMVFHPDGSLYGVAGGRFFRIAPESGDITLLRESDAHLLACDGDGRLYFADGVNLWRYDP